jgi:ubiquinone/menaquinone biosynthesis C-methylase UbiE
MKTNPTSPKPGFIVQSGRQAKALKILKIIEDAGKVRNSSLKLLDIGTGNGEIAFFLSEFFDVTSVDVKDQRSQPGGFKFVCTEGEYLPFENQHFDVVVSNHVIEHVNNADVHLTEIYRILKSDGAVYLATPNRLWPWEVHYRMPMLHYLPQPVFMQILKYMGKYHEEVNLLSWFSLKNKAQNHFSISIFSDSVCKWPQRYYLNLNNKVALLLSFIPLFLYRICTFIHPTLIVVFKPKINQ